MTSLTSMRLGKCYFILTLLAKSTAGMGFPLGSNTLLSRSVFHIWTASNVDIRVTSNTTNAPTASYNIPEHGMKNKSLKYRLH